MTRKNIQMLNLKKPRWLTGAIAGAGVFVLAMGILIASRQPEPDAAPVMAEAPVEEAAAVEPAPEAPPKQVRPRKAASRPAARKTAATRPAPAESAVLVSEAPAVKLATAAPAPVPAGTGATEAAALTTISGCLERDDDRFRLKDTDGENAPKARSWKSGFLKKGSATLNVLDPSDRLKLQNHVGQRVSVTGTLADRDLQARSVQRVAPSCER